MENTFYTLGNFTLGLGSCGTGPSFDIGENMSQQGLIKYNTASNIFTTLVEYGDVSIISNPIIAAGDVQISKDGGAYTNIINMPQVSGSIITVILTSFETTCSSLNIKFSDQTSLKQWNDKILSYTTYGNSSAYVSFDYTNTTSASNFDLNPVTSVINNSSYGLSAINNNVTVTHADVLAVKNKTDQLTFTSGNINAYIANKGVLNDISVSDILGADIDGLTAGEAITRLLAWATGKTVADGAGTFTYYKQDGITRIFDLITSNTTRTRND